VRAPPPPAPARGPKGARLADCPRGREPSSGPVAAALQRRHRLSILRIAGPIELHRHLESEEIVYVLSGEGTLQLDKDTHALRAGDLFVVPRNTPHAFTPTGRDPAVVLQLFTPRFIDGDRVLEAEAK
jgi:mannose-6-phosphate isomerase-like protein (cupin superfamily)